MSCSERKTLPQNRPAPLQQFQETLVPFERVSMDIVGPLQTCNRDAYTRYLEAIALPDQKAEIIAKAFVTEIITRHEAPKQLLTDRGTNFVSQLFKSLCKLLGIKKNCRQPRIIQWETEG